MLKNEAFGIDKHLKVCNSSYWGSCKEWVTVHCWLITKQCRPRAGQLRSVYQKYKGKKKKKKSTNAFWLSNPNLRSYLSSTLVLVGNNIHINLSFSSVCSRKRWETTLYRGHLVDPHNCIFCGCRGKENTLIVIMEKLQKYIK